MHAAAGGGAQRAGVAAADPGDDRLRPVFQEGGAQHLVQGLFPEAPAPQLLFTDDIDDFIAAVGQRLQLRVADGIAVTAGDQIETAVLVEVEGQKILRRTAQQAADLTGERAALIQILSYVFVLCPADDVLTVADADGSAQKNRRTFLHALTSQQRER